MPHKIWKDNSYEPLPEHFVTSLACSTPNGHKGPGHIINKSIRHLQPETRTDLFKTDTTLKRIFPQQHGGSTWIQKTSNKETRRSESHIEN